MTLCPYVLQSFRYFGPDFNPFFTVAWNSSKLLRCLGLFVFFRCILFLTLNILDYTSL